MPRGWCGPRGRARSGSLGAVRTSARDRWRRGPDTPPGGADAGPMNQPRPTHDPHEDELHGLDQPNRDPTGLGSALAGGTARRAAPRLAVGARRGATDGRDGAPGRRSPRCRRRGRRQCGGPGGISGTERDDRAVHRERRRDATGARPQWSGAERPARPRLPEHGRVGVGTSRPGLAGIWRDDGSFGRFDRRSQQQPLIVP
jgi:hypothetical protein